MPKAIVSITKCSAYENIKERLSDNLGNLGGLTRFIEAGDIVLLKPNLIDPFPPERAVTTHPLFVKAMIELVKEAGGTPWVGDCSGGVAHGTTEKVFRISGIAQVCMETGTPIKDFQKTGFVPVDIPNYKILEKTDFARPIFEAKVIINLPKLKTHGLTFFTGAIKNTFGCIHPLEREYLHKNFPKMEDFSNGIVDVFSFVKPQLNIMDAVVGMEGDGGPSNGDPKQIGLVLASEDAVALDAIASKIIGYNPTAIPTTRLAMERGLGVSRLEEIEVVGEKIEEVSVKDFKLHSLAGNKYKKLNGFGSEFVLSPYVNKDKCSRCGTCAENCPAGAITLNPFPEIDRTKCVHCYCCNELCPQGAYTLKKEWLTDKRKPYLIEGETSFVFAGVSEEFSFPKANLITLSLKKGFLCPSNEPKHAPEKIFISPQFVKKDLTPQTLKAVSSFFKSLKEHKTDFILTKPLPPCILNDPSFDSIDLKRFAPPSCSACLELFVLKKDKGIKTCSAFKPRGADLSGLTNRDQIVERLREYASENRQKVNPSCIRCIHRLRGRCCAKYYLG